MQIKHTDKLLLESPYGKQMLAYVQDKNKVSGADNAPWSDGTIQSFDTDPAPRLIATHVTLHTLHAMQKANFNGIAERQHQHGLEIADKAFQLEALAAQLQSPRPEGMTVSERYIQDAFRLDKMDEAARSATRAIEMRPITRSHRSDKREISALSW